MNIRSLFTPTRPRLQYVVSAALLAFYLGALFGYPAAAFSSQRGVAPDFTAWGLIAVLFGCAMSFYSALTKPRLLLEISWLVIPMAAGGIYAISYGLNPEGVRANTGALAMFSAYTFFLPVLPAVVLFIWHLLCCAMVVSEGNDTSTSLGLQALLIVVLVVPVVAVNTMRSSSKQARFQALCGSAGLVIHKRIDKAQGVLVDSSALGKYIHYGYTGPPNPASLLASGNMDFVEVPGAAANSKYGRFSRPTGLIGVDESTADVVIAMKTLTTDDDMGDGLFGEEMAIQTRSGEPLATFRYYWMTPRPVQMCPHPKQGIATSQIATYVVGLKEGLEHKWKEAFLP